jgi:hypothetical protein
MTTCRNIYWIFSAFFETKKFDIGRHPNPRLEYFGRWDDVNALSVSKMRNVMADIEQSLYEDF